MILDDKRLKAPGTTLNLRGHLNEETIQRAAKEMAALMQETFPVHLPDGLRGELSILNVIMLGVEVVTTLGEYLTPDRLAFTVNPALISAALHSTTDPSILEAYLEHVIVQSGSDPQTLIEGIQKAKRDLQCPAIRRKLLADLRSTLLPLGPEGRPSLIRAADWPELLSISDMLIPFTGALLGLRGVSKSRTISDCLAFLSEDYIAEVNYVSEYVSEIEAALADEKLAARMKTPSTRIRKLSDVFAGMRFNLSPRYAMEQANQARRHLRRERARTTEAQRPQPENS